MLGLRQWLRYRGREAEARAAAVVAEAGNEGEVEVVVVIEAEAHTHRHRHSGTRTHNSSHLRSLWVCLSADAAAACALTTKLLWSCGPFAGTIVLSCTELLVVPLLAAVKESPPQASHT